jgi:hypothetical protein
LEKFADIFFHVFSTRCSFGASHEVGSPEDADMNASKGEFNRLEAFLISHFINPKKGGLKG